jgi:nitrite reductase/ring-hydroxylating ferredoxin subunit
MAEVKTAAHTYVLCNAGGEIHALDGICPHRGAPLAYGALHGYTIVCPWHAWEFDCRTGGGELDCLNIHRVTVEGGLILLDAGTA